MSVTFEAILAASKRIAGHINQTPMHTCGILDSMASLNASSPDQVAVERKLYFKCEHLQKTGSFKSRAALNSVLDAVEQHSDNASISESVPPISSAPKMSGVVTHSSGNFGQAVAWAANKVGVASAIVVPRNTAAAKRAAIEAYGAELVLCEDSPQSRIETCEQLVRSGNLCPVHPYDTTPTQAGNGSIALEMLEQQPDLDAVLISISGGGLAVGCATALKHLRPEIKVYLVEPEGKQMQASLQAGQRLWQGPNRFLDTIADGIRLQQPGHSTFPQLCKLVEHTVLTVVRNFKVFALVSEFDNLIYLQNNDDMIEGMKLSFKYMKQVIEPAASAALYAAIKYRKVFGPEIRNIGIVLCGGNCDIEKLPW